VPQMGLPRVVLSTRKGRGWETQVIMETEGLAYSALKEEPRFVF
jgi:hypothetical protein